MTNKELLEENALLKQKIQELEQAGLEQKRVEEALRTSEEQYRILSENSPSMIYLLDLEGNVLVANEASAAQFGLKPDAIIGRNLQDLFPERIAERHKQAIDKVIADGKIIHSELSELFPTGERWIDARIVPVSNKENGKIIAVLGISHDITDRKCAEEALRESEEKFRTIFDRASDGIVIIYAATKKFLQGNAAICSMLGYTKEEIVGLTIHDIHPPKDIPDVLDKFEKHAAMLDGALVEGLPVLRKDGSIFYADVGASPVMIGGIGCLLGIFRDITERKRGEEELNRAKEFLDTVLDNLTDHLIIIDPINYTILGANKTFTDSYGLDKHTVVGRHCYELTHHRATPCSPPNDICPLVETLKSGKPTTVEHIHYDSTGRKLYVEVSAIPIIGKGGKIDQIIHLTRNITERKRAEDNLEKTNLELLAIIDNLPFLAWLKDSEGRFMVVNESFAHSCGLSSTSELVGKTDLDIWPKHLAEAYRADDFEVMRTRQKKSVEELIADQGEQKWFETYKAPLYEVNGNIVGTTGFSRDITERKHWEEQTQQSLESLRRALNTTIQVMVSAVEIRDPYTAGHQIRAANLARAIAAEMGLPQEKIDGIRMVGTIHDIGKLSIPAEILSKPTKLSELEFSLIKEHPRRGFEMLKDVESPWPLAEIVHQHHERMDGSGYPRNLKGEEILMEARILTVADVVEAMASHRPYRPGLGIDAALNEIEKNKGIYYDNAVVDACLRLFREKGFQLEGA